MRWNVRELLKIDWRAQAAMAAAVLVLLQVTGLANVCGIVDRFQTLIGTLIAGAVGFWTVNRQLRENAENTQKEREREIAHEASSVRAALLAELKVLNQTFAIQESTCKQLAQQNNFAVPKQLGGDQLCRVYRAVISRIGLLSANEQSAVVEAYADYEGKVASAKWFEEMQRSSSTDTTKPNQYFDLYLKHVELLLTLTRTAIVALGGKPRDSDALPRAP